MKTKLNDFNMKKYLSLTILIFTLSFVFPIFSFAQEMPALSGAKGMGFPSSSSDSATIQSQRQEEQEGKQFLDSLNNKTVTCSQLKDADFEKIGEYFMGQSIGDTSRHIAMNEMMKSMMGEQGEEQIHIAWGKRGSGCDTSAVFPQNGVGFMSMMSNWGQNPMGWFGSASWLVTLTWIVWLAVGVLAVIWLRKQINKRNLKK